MVNDYGINRIHADRVANVLRDHNQTNMSPVEPVSVTHWHSRVWWSRDGMPKQTDDKWRAGYPPQRDEWEMYTVPQGIFSGQWPRLSKPDGRYVALHGLPLFVLVMSGSLA